MPLKKRLGQAIGIFGVLMVFGGLLWLRGPAMTFPEYGVGFLVVGIGFLISYAGIFIFRHGGVQTSPEQSDELHT